MMFQQEYPYGYSLMGTSLLSNEILDYSDVTSWLNSVYSSSSYSSSVRVSSSTAEQQNHSSPRIQGGTLEKPPRKRRSRTRTRSEKNIEEKENQRLNHIAVERNRRRQINDFISVLKSMMPLSYSQHSDQASIIEGTINYLKKQEQLLQSLQAQLKATRPIHSPNTFSDFFTFPQYSSSSSNHGRHEPVVADVEVTMMERHANIKVLTKTKPKLLFKIVCEFYSLGLSTLHLNLTTSKDMSLLTFSVKVEEHCQLETTVKGVANAVHEVIKRIHKGS